MALRSVDLSALNRATDYFDRHGRSFSEVFPELDAENLALAKEAKARRAARRAGDFARANHHDRAVQDLRRKIIEHSTALLAGQLNEVNDFVDSPATLWSVTVVAGVAGGKPAYKLTDMSRAREIARHLIVEDLRDALRVAGSNRNELCKALHTALCDAAPRVVVRTDIESFYESVPHDVILNAVSASRKISRIAHAHVAELLKNYGGIVGAPRGLPRGLGISAVLAELVVSRFDDVVGIEADVIEYFRFVDDIVVIYGQGGRASRPQDRRSQLGRSLGRLGLKMNLSKTQAFALPIASSSTTRKLEYLGYAFHFQEGAVRVELSVGKILRIERRIDAAIEAFRRSPTHPSAERQLAERIELLTSSYRLAGRKARSFVGLPFSSPLVEPDSDSIRGLDLYLTARLASAALPVSLATKLSEHSFADGISSARFIQVSGRRLSRLRYPWRNLAPR